ncbi:MAG: peptide chain release factor 1 [Christensenellaceae bacterium]|nr:peptide chain release factor 1 [Christensenellaceae bacterium]
MFERLESMKKRFAELSEEIGKSEVIANQDLWRKLIKEHADLQEIVEKYEEYLDGQAQLADLAEMLKDPDNADMAEMIEEEMAQITDRQPGLIEQLKFMLIPKDPSDDKNVMVEIRAGTGGDEASLFGMDLLRMYTRYAERAGYKTEILSSNYTELGGVKEVILSVAGKGAYSKLKYESGVHRVQRVPETESGGRIHTSAATVAVLPEAEDVDVQVNPADLRIDVYRASGNGGQCVNTTDSAVRITHLPTGLVVTCQDEKSQLKNKEKCMKVLKARLYDMAKSQQEAAMADARKSQVGSGDRSERIRTYNFPQGRVTDHRIGLTLYKLEAFLDGDMQEILDALIFADKEKSLSAVEE